MNTSDQEIADAITDVMRRAYNDFALAARDMAVTAADAMESLHEVGKRRAEAGKVARVAPIRATRNEDRTNELS